MNKFIPRTLFIIAGSSLMVFILFPLLMMSMWSALLAPVLMICLGIILMRPFLGLALIVAFAQLDAIANILFQGLPLSGVKVLTIFTLAGVILNSFWESRKERLGPDELALRMAILFGITLLVSFFFVEDRALGVWSLRRIFSVLVLFYLVIRLTVTSRQVEILLLIIICSTLISSGAVLWDWGVGGHSFSSEEAATTAQWQGVSRSAGASDYNPTTASHMVLAGTCLALMLSLRTRRWRALTIATVFFGSAGMVLSFARSTSLVFGLMLGWLCFKLINHRHFPLLVSTALIVGVCGAFFVPLDYWARLGTLFDIKSDYTLQRRIGYHLIGIDLFIHNPLLGVGPGNFQHHYMSIDYLTIPGRRLVHRHLHNMYFSIAAETGLMGLTCFIGMLIAAMKGVYNTFKQGATEQLRTMGESLHFSYVAFLMACVFMPNEYNKYTWILTGLAVAVARVNRETPCRNSLSL